MQELIIIYHGSKAFLIPNTFPMGVLASYLSRYRSDKPRDYDEHGCLMWLNEVSQKHNQALSGEVARLAWVSVNTVRMTITSSTYSI